MRIEHFSACIRYLPAKAYRQHPFPIWTPLIFFEFYIFAPYPVKSIVKCILSNILLNLSVYYIYL
jgi:hypothetical protein